MIDNLSTTAKAAVKLGSRFGVDELTELLVPLHGVVHPPRRRKDLLHELMKGEVEVRESTIHMQEPKCLLR